MTKQYDREYFDRWYRGTSRVNAQAEVRRKVALALSVAEYYLHRPVQSVLDVGCGEGAWFQHLRAVRPRVAYLGLDPSDYVVRRFGRTRNIRQAAFADLHALQLEPGFDLIVCSDVLHYVPEKDIAAGIAEIARLLEGVAYLEVLTREDDIVGDLEGLHRRPADWYRRVFKTVGLMPSGPYSWLAGEMVQTTAELERP